uniref:Anthocyanidin 3-O-glucosyltransferase n=1 Tax=Cajanus cajan TaxID=3821 RepID=A0A151UCV9_CAJCA|nr:Anthocyanidin 3-O-glucosyltransferase [Cajanus cajan]
MAENNIRVVMLPWSAFGHLIPFFKLSTALAKAGVRVSFISSPKNIQRLPKLPSTLSHLVELVQLSLPSLDKELLPEGAEATVDIPFEQIHWMKDIAHEFQVKLLFFNVFSASTITFFGAPTRKILFPPEWVRFPSSVAFRRHEPIAFCANANQVNASGISDLERLAEVLTYSEIVLFRSCYEIKGEYLTAFQKLVGKHVILVGMIELSLLPVERPERGGNQDSVPYGFHGRTSNRGIVCMGWIPQKKLRINTREAAAIVGNLKLHQDHYIAAFVQFLKDGIWKLT